MTNKNGKYQYCMIALLSCLMWVAGIDVYAQSPDAAPADSIIVSQVEPKARAKREHLADSIADDNNKKLAEMESHITPPSVVATVDTVAAAKAVDKKVWMPNPSRATWLAVVFPGAGQIYNRKFWKLPIIYGGFAGCAYALAWNGKMYKDYSQAYLDIMDSDPNTDSYLDLFSNRVSSYSESQLASLIKKRKDTFRRYRDLSIFATIGVYLISIVDAYVDAELSNFDITPDLSMSIEPAVINTNNYTSGTRHKSVGLQCCFRF